MPCAPAKRRSIACGLSECSIRSPPRRLSPLLGPHAKDRHCGAMCQWNAHPRGTRGSGGRSRRGGGRRVVDMRAKADGRSVGIRSDEGCPKNSVWRRVRAASGDSLAPLELAWAQAVRKPEDLPCTASKADRRRPLRNPSGAGAPSLAVPFARRHAGHRFRRQC
jgi:hypothetical protein